MEGNKIQKNEALSVDLSRIFRALLHNGWLIALVSVFAALLVFLGTFFFVTPQYESTTMFYVNNNNLSFGDTSVSISSGDLTTSRNLVDSYIVILNTRETLNDVIDYAGVNRTYRELKEMIKAAAVNETEIFKVTVTSPDPEEAKCIADAIAYILPKRISTIIDGTSVKVADAAEVPVNPSSPNYTVNALVGFLIAFVLAVGIITVHEIYDITIRTENDINLCCRQPILATIPDMTAAGKGGSAYYGYGKGKSGKKEGKYSATSQAAKNAIIGPGISFAASEAYKLLRTKLEFSFADENNCRIIGISSALSGEGKSLTAVNLAFTLSQLNKKVLLVDCDMRRPTLAEKLGIMKQPGLSSYLTRQCSLEELVQMCGIKSNENAFHVISAGQTPPNPIELLSSERMKKALNAMREAYDYVILDFPPVGEVSDAMAVTKEIDGMLLVVRQNGCDRVILSETVRQFEFINAKILGVIFNGTSEESGNYGKGYYKSYYQKRGNKYGDAGRMDSGANRNGNK